MCFTTGGGNFLFYISIFSLEYGYRTYHALSLVIIFLSCLCNVGSAFFSLPFESFSILLSFFSLSPASAMLGLHFPLHPFYHTFPDFSNASFAFTLTRASFFFFFGLFSFASVMLGLHFPFTPCIYFLFFFQISL